MALPIQMIKQWIPIVFLGIDTLEETIDFFIYCEACIHVFYGSVNEDAGCWNEWKIQNVI